MILIVQIAAALTAVIIGLFLYLKPSETIELQKKFYERINWRMEPISMAREIRNTKIMGLFLLGCALVIVISAEIRWGLLHVE